MDVECKFGLQYTPLRNGAPDAVLLTHLENCADCQEQVIVVG